MIHNSACLELTSSSSASASFVPKRHLMNHWPSYKDDALWWWCFITVNKNKSMCSTSLVLLRWHFNSSNKRFRHYMKLIMWHKNHHCQSLSHNAVCLRWTCSPKSPARSALKWLFCPLKTTFPMYPTAQCSGAASTGMVGAGAACWMLKQRRDKLLDVTYNKTGSCAWVPSTRKAQI